MIQTYPPQTVLNWIKKLVPGKSFADVGGLLFETHETVTGAVLAGARNASMCDLMNFSCEWWDKFRKRCRSCEVSNVKEVSANVDDDQFVDLLGVHNVVHCGGVIYHCPNPIHTISQLCKITKEWLIIGTSVVTNEFDPLIIPGSVIFVPALNKEQILKVFKWLNHKQAILTDHKNTNNYAPFWWLPTPEAVEGWIEVNGFKVTETHKEKTIHYFLCKNNKLNITCLFE